MAFQKSKTARAVAADVLRQFDPKRNYASPILNRLLEKTQEKQRATDLVFGCVRNRCAIDTVIAKFANCPVKRITTKLLNIIRVATFELIYSPATPEYSIVNEAVENARAVGGRKQTGFVNAVLRQIARHITDRHIQLAPPLCEGLGLEQADARRILPQTPATGCEFDTCFLPEPAASPRPCWKFEEGLGSPTDYLSAAFSLPQWLIADWLGEFGTELTRQICFASNRRPSIYLRPNSLKTTPQELAEKLRQEGIEPEIVPDETMIKVKAAQAVTQLVGFEEGLFTVQDITASQAVRILAPQPSPALPQISSKGGASWTILDLCAAPGVKTTQLAELTADSAKIIATDIDPKRLKKVKENIARLGIKSITVVEYEQLFNNSKFSILNSKFDAVLLDVPCSNTGVLAKRIEARYRVTPEAIRKLTKIQSELLASAAKLIKPQGRIAYSTCSIQKQENQELVAEFLKPSPSARGGASFEIESEKLILPSAEDFDHDGGYIAILAGR